MTTVSVIIPAYNREQTIRTAIDSALAQTVREVEVIVVDDGSTDRTAEVAQSTGDARVRVVAHEQNRGAAAARNTGIAAANGAFIALLDSDDTWASTKLERQLAALRAGPSAAAAICGVHMRLLDQGRAYDAIPEAPTDWLRRLLADCGVNPGATLIASRAAFERVGPMDEALMRFEDWDWLVRYAASGGAIAIVPEVLAIVNNRRGRLGKETEAAASIFLRKHAALRSRYGAAFARRAEVDVWMQVAGTHAFAGAWGDFARVYGRALMMDPAYCAGRLARAAWRAGGAQHQQ